MSRQDDVRALIQALKREVEAKYRRLGELLKEVRDKEYWREWGYASFEAFCEEEIGYQERKCRYLIATVEGFERGGVTEEEAAAIDQSKAAVIAPVLTPENKEEWVAKARTMRTDELKREVARSQGREVSDEVARPFTVMLYPDQWAVKDEAMRLARKVAATDVAAVAFMAMCQEFIGTYSHLGQDPVEAPADEETHGQDPDL